MKWKETFTGIIEDFRGVVWDGRRFVAGSDKSTCVSVDGVSWERIGKAPRGSIRLFAEGVYCGASWGGNLWHSADGLRWDQADAVSGNSFNAIAYGEPERHNAAP